ncbi:MAG: outer membrane protein transport protein [Sphingomonadales bacterium]
MTGAEAAGFMLMEQSARASGRAYAGEAAMADNASVLFFNPAGMTRLQGPVVEGGAYVIMPKARLSDQGSTMTVGPFPAMPVGGADNGQGFSAQPVGSFYGAMPVTRDLWVGLAVTVPFGLKNKYDTDYFGRYDSTSSKVLAIDVAPTVAYRVNEYWSIGGAVNFQRAEATLVNALPNPLAPEGIGPDSDGRFTVDGSDWTIGFTAGILLQVTDEMRVGVSYRSAISHRLTGTATTELGGMVAPQGVAADLDLPDTLSVAVAYELTPRLTFMTQFNYHGWDRFEEVRLELEDGSELATAENFRNTWGVAAGVEIVTNERWSLRFGAAYDRTPTRDEFRSTRIPDASRIWGSLGATYNVNDWAAIDLSYARMFAKTVPVNRTNDFAALATTVETMASGRVSSNVVGVMFRGTF